MEHEKRIVLIGFLISMITLSLLANPAKADSKVYHGQVVGIEFTVLQVRADDGRISTRLRRMPHPEGRG